MNFDLFVPYITCEGRLSDEVRIAIEKMVKCGWDGICLTVSVNSGYKIPLPPEPIPLSEECEALIRRRYGLTVLYDYPQFPQFRRLNLETDRVSDVNQMLKSIAQKSATHYDIISVTPLSDEVYRHVCQTANVDIISLDLSRYEPKKKWKELKSAKNRDIAVELRYSQFLGSSELRRKFVNALSQSITFVMRGKGIILSCGSLETEHIRSPSDVINIACLNNIRKPLEMTNDFVKYVLGRGMARNCHVGITRKVDTSKLDIDDSDSDETPIIITLQK